MAAMRPDQQAIVQWVPQGARVLDLGCGDGSLLRSLWQVREAPGYGVEIDDDSVLACVANDVNVLQVDLESGLSLFGDKSFDCVILSETLQTIHRTELLMREMLRVGREVIVSFPNFGHWSARLQVALGRMPVSETLPYPWYETMRWLSSSARTTSRERAGGKRQSDLNETTRKAALARASALDRLPPKSAAGSK